MTDPVDRMRQLAATYRGRVRYFVGRDPDEALVRDGKVQEGFATMGEAEFTKADLEARLATEGANDREVRIYGLSSS